MGTEVGGVVVGDGVEHGREEAGHVVDALRVKERVEHGAVFGGEEAAVAVRADDDAVVRVVSAQRGGDFFQGFHLSWLYALPLVVELVIAQLFP